MAEFELVNNGGEVSLAPASFTLPNGVQISLVNATQAGSDGVWTVNFTYALTSAQHHQNAEAVGAGDVIDSVIGILVVDETGDYANSQITVTVHDDGPKFTADAADKADDLEGAFQLAFGADGAAAVDSILVDGKAPESG